MKKILLLLLLLFSTTSTVSASENIQMQLQENWSGILNYDDRTSGTSGEEQASKYIYEQLNQFGYKVQIQDFTYPSDIDSSNIESQNVIATKDCNCGSDATIIIGSHYDNVYDSTAAEGANDNASGVAVNLTLAENLAQVNLPYNIVFVFFGAEEVGLYGSTYFVEQLTNQQIANINLYINLDCIAIGDEMYFFTNAEDSSIDNYLLDIAKVEELSLYPEDLEKEIAMYSDYNNFIHLGIPTIGFMGEYESNLYEEVTNPILHTENDNQLYINENFNNKSIDTMEIAYEAIYQILLDENLLTMLDSSTYYSLPQTIEQEQLILKIIIGIFWYFMCLAIMALILIVVALISLFVKKPKDKIITYTKNQFFILGFGIIIAIISLIGYFVADVNIATYFFISYCIGTIVIPAIIFKKWYANKNITFITGIVFLNFITFNLVVLIVLTKRIIYIIKNKN